MLHVPPPAQSATEERLNFLPGDESAVCLLVCRAGSEHCALIRLCSMAVGLDTSAEQSNIGVGWPKGKVQIWGLLFLISHGALLT